MVTTKRTLCESEINKPPQKTKKSAFMYVTWINDSKTRFSEQNKLMKFVCDAAKPATESLTGLLEFLNKLNKLCDVTIMERRLTVFHIYLLSREEVTDSRRPVFAANSFFIRLSRNSVFL